MPPGPVTPTMIGGRTTGGNTSATSSSSTYRPAVVTRSPSRRRRTASTVSSSAASCDGGNAPIWRIHGATPWPIPATNLPGNSRSTPANSIAVMAALRATAATMPMPTVIVSVLASAATTAVSPPAQKQSSTIHSSSKPADSTKRANTTRSSGGRSRRNIAPNETDAAGAVIWAAPCGSRDDPVSSPMPTAPLRERAPRPPVASSHRDGARRGCRP